MSNASDNEYSDHKIKLILIGDSKVGKTSFLEQFINNKFNNNQLSTIGFNVLSKICKLSDGTKVRITFFDTSGQERYKSLPASYFRNIQGILLMYDITEKKSFDHVNVWLNMIKDFQGGKTVPIVLLGNKIDLKNERKISNEEGEEKAKELNLKFYEISAKDNINIKAAINHLVIQAIHNTNNKQNVDNENENIELASSSNKSKKKHKKKCC